MTKVQSLIIVLLLAGLPIIGLGQVRGPSFHGTLEKYVFDNETETVNQHVLKTGKREYELVGSEEFDSLVNTKVTVFGRLKNQKIFVSTIEAIDPVPAPEPKGFPAGLREVDLESKDYVTFSEEFLTLPPATSGLRETRFILFAFSDDPNRPLTPTDVYNLTLANDFAWPTLTGFFRDVSGRKFNIYGSVYPEWVVIPQTRDFCKTGSNMYNDCTNSVMSILQQRGEVLDEKSLVFIYPPVPNSTAGPVAQQGVKGDGSLQRKVWLPLTPLVIERFIHTAAHEIGHNQGYGHAGSRGGDGVTYLTQDRADYMGAGETHLNLYHRLMTGWFPGGKLFTISGPGVYDVWIFPPDRMVKKHKGVLIDIRNSQGILEDKLILLEDRRSLLPYEDLSGDPLWSSGLIVREGLRDMTQSESIPTVLPKNTHWNPDLNPVQLGEFYQDLPHGLTVEYKGQSIAGGMWLRITLTQ